MVITTAQLHSTKPELRFWAGSNPARGVSGIHNITALIISKTKKRVLSKPSSKKVGNRNFQSTEDENAVRERHLNGSKLHLNNNFI